MYENKCNRDKNKKATVFSVNSGYITLIERMENRKNANPLNWAIGLNSA